MILSRTAFFGVLALAYSATVATGCNPHPVPDVMTPLEKLASLPPNARGLRPAVSLEQLQIQARARTDLQAADALNDARRALFASFRKRA